MERLVSGKIITQLEGNNLIGDSQHGFRNQRSCLTSRIGVFARVIDTYDAGNNKAVDLINLNFQKAFDKVPHERLLINVTAHGIQCYASQWIRNWLAGGRERVLKVKSSMARSLPGENLLQQKVDSISNHLQ